ncbi:MAG: hypothetical protein GY820_21235 [Gammaproteobacteria bacterium]|nr:hypothetical protein [Gammaproteobacteria bacterium]
MNDSEIQRAKARAKANIDATIIKADTEWEEAKKAYLAADADAKGVCAVYDKIARTATAEATDDNVKAAKAAEAKSKAARAKVSYKAAVANVAYVTKTDIEMKAADDYEAACAVIDAKAEL